MQARPDARRVRFAFVAAVLGGLLGFALLPSGVAAKFGIAGADTWFLDTYAILASSDAVQAGKDPSQPNPLDVYGRPHSYSSWWFVLGELGFTRSHNALFGGIVVSGFVLAALLYLRPRTRAEAWCGALAVLSPVVLLAFNRANNDLVVWAVLVGGLLVLKETAPWRLALFAASVTLATGLKFYPVLAGAALLVIPWRISGWALVGTAVGSAGVLASQWDWFRRAVIPVPEGVYLFGAGVWWREWGLSGWALPACTFLLLATGAWWLNRRGWCRDLADDAGATWERAGFAAGAALLVGCWLAGISFAYRWVFALLLLPWLWRGVQRGDRVARLGLALVIACCWLDSLFCLATNMVIGPMPLGRLRSLQHGWQMVLQPVVALLMLLCVAWLRALLVVRWREIPWPSWRLSPATRGWFLIFVLLGALVYVQSDRLRQVFGLPNSETWFLDSYAVLAASDAHQAGLDAAAVGHFDPLGRPHRYSDWWYGLGWMGVSRDDNFAFGLVCVGMALAAAVATFRVTSWSAMVWALLVLLSPAVFLGFNRANNDLVIFGLLGLALMALRGNQPWRHAMAALAIGLAAGLKFYPAVAALPLWWFHFRAGRRLTAWVSASVVGIALLAVWPDMARGRFPVEVSVHVWGAAIWPQDLGHGNGLLFGLLGALVLAAVVLARRTHDAKPVGETDAHDELTMMMGAVVLLACFAAGLNYGYRWIFALWLGSWWLHRANNLALPGSERAIARLTWILVPVVIWLDGLLCLAANTGGLDAAGLSHAQLQLAWRLLTQPIVWLLMALLASALIVMVRPPWRRRRLAS